MSTFLIYARELTAKRAYPVARGGLAKNLIHAIRFLDRDTAEKCAASLREDNPEWHFEVRERRAKASTTPAP